MSIYDLVKHQSSTQARDKNIGPAFNSNEKVLFNEQQDTVMHTSVM